MYKERIELFRADNPAKVFPDFYELSVEECQKNALIISKKFLNGAYEGMDLVLKLIKIANSIDGIDASSGTFSLVELLKKQQVCYTEEGYIDWYRFDDTTAMKIRDINSVFDYLYFPSADDIQIYDDSFSWILFVKHYGEVFLLK